MFCWNNGGIMTITYETLFEVLRRERNQEDLQKLADNFFSELKQYIEEKNKALFEKPRLDQFIEGHENEHDAIRIQLMNIRKLAKDVFERRKRKIIDMAINKAKTSSAIIDTSALLPEEKDFFNEQIKLISVFRNNVLETTLGYQKTAENSLKSTENEAKELNRDSLEQDNEEFKKVQVLEEIPKFVGVDLEIYGPFNSDEEIELRPEIAEMLVKANKAKVVE